MLTQNQHNNVLKLIAALESETYKQSRYALRNTMGFCVLGVACDVSGLGEWVNFREYKVLDEESGTFKYGEIEMPKPVASHYGFPSHDGPHFVFRDLCTDSLLSLNDSARLKFPQIADVLRWWLTWDANKVEE